MTARKTKLHTHCLNCGLELTGKYQQKFCNNQTCGVAWRTKNVYRYKYTFAHRSKSPRNFLRALINKKNRNKTISLDFLVDLFIRQEGKCAVSNIPMTFIAGEGRVDTNISIDQIKAGEGYTEDNVQLVCRRVNHMKHDYPIENLYEWCERIIECRKTTTDLN